MGIELEWFVLLVLHLVGTSVFGVFEVETPWWRLVLKWGTVIALTWAAYRFFGHWALAVPLGLSAAGFTVHLVWCRRHGIDPWQATPRKKYYRLRGWAWME